MQSAPTEGEKMALHPCAECQKDVSDKAIACPHCGMPQSPPGGVAFASGEARNGRSVPRGAAVAVVLVLVVGGLLALAFRTSESRGLDYARVEQLRAEQDADGTRDQNVRQRFYRLYKAHPQSAMYIYLWARCVGDAAEQQKLAEEGIRADPRFSWNYNLLARALARQHHVPEAYDEAVKGSALDPGNMQLADKQTALKAMLDHKLEGEAAPVAGADDRAPARYEGLFGSAIRSPDRSDTVAIETSHRLDGAEKSAAIGDAVRGFSVCANPFADSCVRVYLPRDGRFKTAWQVPATDVTAIKEHQLVTVAGSAVKNSRGETILLADTVTVEAP